MTDKPAPKHRHLVLIEWLDARGVTTDWESPEDASRDLVTVSSVGWLISRCDRGIVLAPHVAYIAPHDGRDEVCGVMTIPTACLVSLHYLESALP